MRRVSKKLIKQIEFCSVYDDVIREYHNTSAGCFIDDPPEEWNKWQREIFDVATDIEDRLKAAILMVLGIAANPE